MSGFSAMTSALMAHGQHGAEVLAQVMRAIFDPLVEAVYAHGGFITVFAGDAFTAVFPACRAARPCAPWTDRGPTRPGRGVDHAPAHAERIPTTRRPTARSRWAPRSGWRPARCSGASSALRTTAAPRSTSAGRRLMRAPRRSSHAADGELILHPSAAALLADAGGQARRSGMAAA